MNPIPEVSVNPKTKTIDIGEKVVFTATGAYDYSWTPTTFIVSGKDLNTMETSPDNTITYTLTGKDGKGCTNTVKVTITVRGTTSISSNASVKVDVFPNPTSENLYVKSETKLTYRLVDINGKLVRSESRENFYHHITVSDLSAGIYFIELFKGNDRVENHKIKVDR